MKKTNYFPFPVNLAAVSCIYRAEPKSEVSTMCPEPEFGMQYRRMIEVYRLPPEVLRGQLASILSRVTQAEVPIKDPAESKKAVH